MKLNVLIPTVGLFIGLIFGAQLAQTKTQTQALRGNESAGGGGVWYKQNTPILVDFFNIDSNFEDTSSFREWTASQVEVDFQLSLTRANEYEFREQIPALDLALTIVEKWEQQFLDVTGSHIHSAFMLPMQWNFSYRKLSAPESYLPLPIIQQSNIKTVAYYESATVDIDIQVWNEAGVITQAGTFIHEAFRRMQIGWSNRFDELSLQQATALVMMC